MKSARALSGLSSLVITFCVLNTGQAMAQTWTGNTDALWDTDANWSDTPPASSGSSALIFNPANLTGSAILATSNDLTLFTATSIDFNNSTTAGAFTLAGNQITLGGNITTTGSTGTPAHTISLATILNGNRTITTALDNNLSISGIISQDIAGRSLTKAGAGLLTLSGANSYSGGTNINQGTVQVNTGGTLGATTGALTTGSGSDGVLGPVGNLTLNTGAQVGAMTVKSNTADTTTPANIGQLSIASASTLTASSLTVGISSSSSTNAIRTALATGSTPGAGGTLTVNGNVSIGQSANSTSPNTTVVDLSGLHTFNATSTSGTFDVGNGTNNKGTLTLANNANTINVGTITVGSSPGTTNYVLAEVSTLTLGGGTNVIQANTINLGVGKASGRILNSGSGAVTITGTNGIGTSNITIANHTNNTFSVTANSTSRLDLAGINASVSAGTVTIAQKSGGTAGSITGALTFDTGTFAASTVRMAVASSGDNATSLNAAFTVGGATANSAATGIVNISGNLLMALASGGLSNPISTLTINGGTVNVNTSASPTGGILDNSTTIRNSSNTPSSPSRTSPRCWGASACWHCCAGGDEEILDLDFEY